MAAILDDLDDNPDWDKSPEESLSDYSIHIIVTGTDLPAIVYHVHRVMLAVRSTHFKSISLPLLPKTLAASLREFHMLV